MTLNKLKRATAVGLVTAFIGTTVIDSAAACSRILWNTNNQAHVVARTVDLFRSDEAKIVAYPRGMARVSKTDDGASFEWKTKFGSIAVTAFGVATSDGMNEKGLVTNLLYLDETKYEPRDKRPGLTNILWAQYVLDNFGTVKEALEGMKAVQIVSAKAADRDWPLHLSISDADGDSAVLEFVDGKMVVHHGKEFTVMTNEPPLATQLENIKNYKLFGGTKTMPGDIDPASRFVRAASYLKTLPAAKTLPETIAGVYAVARTVAVPRGAEDTSGGEAQDTWPTLWFSIADSTNKTYYFQSTTAPNLYWIDLAKIDFGSGTARQIDAYDLSLSGDATSRILAAN